MPHRMVDFSIATISECFASGIAASNDFQCEIGWPYFFSIDGKYDAGPVTLSALILGTGSAGTSSRSAR